jgi:hypothetical protein
MPTTDNPTPEVRQALADTLTEDPAYLALLLRAFSDDQLLLLERLSNDERVIRQDIARWSRSGIDPSHHRDPSPGTQLAQALARYDAGERR